MCWTKHSLSAKGLICFIYKCLSLYPNNSLLEKLLGTALNKYSQLCGPFGKVNKPIQWRRLQNMRFTRRKPKATPNLCLFSFSLSLIHCTHVCPSKKEPDTLFSPKEIKNIKKSAKISNWSKIVSNVPLKLSNSRRAVTEINLGACMRV